MAKGKFRKDMRVREQQLQNNRNYSARPTENGNALANSYNKQNPSNIPSNYFDHLIEDLLDEANKNHRRGHLIEIDSNHCLYRKYRNGENCQQTACFYFNCVDMEEFSDNYEIINREKTVYFVSVENGLKFHTQGSKQPYINITRASLLESLTKNGIINQKQYKLHELPRKGNTRVWFIEL